MVATPEAVIKAILSGALQKANDAVHADQIQDWRYAIDAYVASCELLGQAMRRTEAGSTDWNKINAIVSISLKRKKKKKKKKKTGRGGMTDNCQFQQATYQQRIGEIRGYTSIEYKKA